MKTSEAQFAANMKYRKTQKRVEVVFSLDQFEDVQSYAESKGMAIGTCLKDCIRRCMEMDAGAVREVESAVGNTEQHDEVANVAAELVGDAVKKIFKQFDIEVTIRER